MWSMDGEEVLIVDENEHLGRVVTGFGEEERNVMENISRGRKSIYSLLGPAFSHKCDLNPAVQVHLFRLFSSPIALSGLSSLSVRPNHMKPMTAMTVKCPVMSHDMTCDMTYDITCHNMS